MRVMVRVMVWVMVREMVWVSGRWGLVWDLRVMRVPLVRAALTAREVALVRG